ncbi:flagellar basal body P-ring protein FlgI, partial [Rhizobium ruizarguesonis]
PSVMVAAWPSAGKPETIATSLRGGTLVMTSLSGADGQIYAVAQGAAIVSGVQAQGKAANVTEGVTTAGRVPGGAIIERE